MTNKLFSLEDAVLTVDGIEITGYENAQDAISIAPLGDDGELTYGIGGNGVFIHSCNHGATVTLKTLQHSETNQRLNELRNHQINNPTTAKGLLITYKDLRNGDEFLLTGCWFSTPPTHARGTSHNGVTWTFKATKAEFKLKGGM
ncbi:DUF3277 family protein [Orbaceae bacterium ESL0727]|nr:DUF3277 family protein [Orbaceae bacterium ESL0727]